MGSRFGQVVVAAAVPQVRHHQLGRALVVTKQEKNGTVAAPSVACSRLEVEPHQRLGFDARSQRDWVRPHMRQSPFVAFDATEPKSVEVLTRRYSRAQCRSTNAYSDTREKTAVDKTSSEPHQRWTRL